MRLSVTRVAEAQIREANDWWVENRQQATGLFREELRRAFDMVTAFPDGTPTVTNVEISGVRRVLMRRCGYHLYYRALEDTVEILALWHSRRGKGPQL